MDEDRVYQVFKEVRRRLDMADDIASTQRKYAMRIHVTDDAIENGVQEKRSLTHGLTSRFKASPSNSGASPSNSGDETTRAQPASSMPGNKVHPGPDANEQIPAVIPPRGQSPAPGPAKLEP